MEKIGRWTKATAAGTAVVLSIGATSVASAVTTSTVGDGVTTAAALTASSSARRPAGPMLAWAPMVNAPGRTTVTAGPPTTAGLGHAVAPPALATASEGALAPVDLALSDLALLGRNPVPDAKRRVTVDHPSASAENINPWLAPSMVLPHPSTAPELEIGDEGDAVVVLERRLTELGYRTGELDGYFSYSTWSAVLAFQKAEGIDRSGWVDATTWAHLAAPKAWRPTNSITYPRVEVDIERQITLVIFGPRHVITLNSSTGGGYEYLNQYGYWEVAETPLGAYNVYRSYDGAEEAPLGTLYRPLYFYQGYAIHGSNYVPDYPDSHGCVRVSNEDMDWLWDHAGEEMAVTLFATMNPSEFYPGTGRYGAPAMKPPPPPTIAVPL